MTFDLFGDPPPAPPRWLAPGALLLPGFLRTQAPVLLDHIRRIAAQAPFRHMTTPGGGTMSVMMTGCGQRAWVSDATGYRYSDTIPDSGTPWPAMPSLFLTLADQAAAAAGYSGFRPDSCLVNRYAPGASMGLHQDRDEKDRQQPIVSFSLGLTACFLFGGPRRTDPRQRVPLHHGDALVWGGPSRLHYHGVARLAAGDHPLTGPCRYNLTLRRAV